MADLNALLHDPSLIPTDEPLTLFAAELDRPFDYLFESNHWQEVVGASQQLTGLTERYRAALAAEGILEALHLEMGGVFALVGDQHSGERLQKAIERSGPEATGIVTLSSTAFRLTVRQLIEGPGRAPTQVIGIPGVNSYQGRINAYYGVESHSTIPPQAKIAARRHFGQTVGLIRHHLQRAREERLITPFYECLPFAERCSSCRNRPAERLLDNLPLCGICQRKRDAAPGQLGEFAGLIVARAAGLSQQLEGQRTPAAYRRRAAEVSSAWQQAAIRSGARVLWHSGDLMLLASSGERALEAAALLGSAFEEGTRDFGLVLSQGVGLGRSGPQPLRQAAEAALSEALRSAETSRIALRFEGPLGDPARRQLQAPAYTPDTALRLYQAAKALGAAFPDDAFPDLALQIARGTASLYYGYGRSRLGSGQRQRLDQFEDEWGKDTMRFYHALDDLMGLLRLSVSSERHDPA